MTRLATNPIVIIALGLLLGVGSGLGWFWKNAAPLVLAAKEARAKAVDDGKPEAPWGFWTLEIENLAAELKDQKAILQQRAETLAQREERFETERQELVQQRRQIEALRAEIDARVVEIEAGELKNLKVLAATYSNLSPKAMLTIFKEMDDAMVVKILALMKTDIVSPLFEEMSKQAATDPDMARRAAQLSEKLRLFMSAQSGS